VAFSVDELKVIKNEWTKIVRDSCRRNKLECRYLNSGEIDKALNVFIDFVKWDQAPKFIHKINYQKRHWVEDYVKFTEQNPNCPNPPEWLQHYSNTSRAFGWWKQLKAFGGGNDLKPEPKIDCNTGEELVYVRHVNSFLDLQDLPLYCYDNCKGKPIIAPLNSNDVAWLKSCFAANLYDKYYDPGGE